MMAHSSIEEILRDHAYAVAWLTVPIVAAWWGAHVWIVNKARSYNLVFRISTFALMGWPAYILVTNLLRSFTSAADLDMYERAQMLCLTAAFLLMYVQNAVRMLIPPRTMTFGDDFDRLSRSIGDY